MFPAFLLATGAVIACWVRRKNREKKPPKKADEEMNDVPTRN